MWKKDDKLYNRDKTVEKLSCLLVEAFLFIWVFNMYLKKNKIKYKSKPKRML